MKYSLVYREPCKERLSRDQELYVEEIVLGTIKGEIPSQTFFVTRDATMDNDLICNYKKCRKRLTTFAWVTSCSHIFCDEDGTREFNKCYTCPACETSLSDKFDIVRIDLQPSEQYKSMVLAGQRPEVIMEICSRAMSFWTYQSHQERTYQEYMCNKAKERSVQLEKYYEQVLSTTQAELSCILL
ncbi:cyclin B1 interacting protein 1, E3 ubiquitin protein ligase [Branchiostoma belcheri]|nr:cyclin B1 interacting protein 1, E3 ubiquitin protein ligase [Branchiostoma belcheri]